MDREARGFLKVMVMDARGFVPSSMPQNLHNWGNATLGPLTKAQSESRPFPKYESGAIKVGLKYKVGGMKNSNSGFRAIYALRNESPAGAIYETAGRINPDGLPYGGPKASRTDRKVSHSRNPKAGAWFINELDKNDNQRQIKGKKDQVLLGLTTGGLRSLTGAIGKNDHDAYKQFGNAVNVDVIHYVMERTFRTYSDIDLFNMFKI